MQYPVPHALPRRENSRVLTGALVLPVLHSRSTWADVAGSNLYILK